MTRADGAEVAGRDPQGPIPTSPVGGLSGREAEERRRLCGPNAVPEERPRPVRAFLRKLWAPVPWMLELTLVLELALGRSTQAAIIAALLLLNAGLTGYPGILRRRKLLQAQEARRAHRRWSMPRCVSPTRPT